MMNLIKMGALIIMSLSASACASNSTGPNFNDLRWVDLSHDFADDTLYWPTASKFRLKTVAEGQTESGYYYSAYELSTSEHGGTHLDAPVHFHEGGSFVHEISLERLIGPVVVINVSDAASQDSDYLIQPSDIEAWEALHGRIKSDSIVLFNTGWARFWPDAKAYLGTAARGNVALKDLHFPGLSADAAKLLADGRSVKAVGIDTASLDHGQSADFLAHQVLSASDIPGFENMANLEAIPPKGAYLIALPMKIRSGSGGPLRVVAGLEK